MDNKINYTVIGLFVIGLSIILVAGFFFLSSQNRGKKYDTYLVYVHEEVSGLSVQSIVRYNGVPVGFVKAIDLDPHNPQLVKLTLEIQQGTPISTSTVATLDSQGITGVVFVGLSAETVNAPALKAHPGEKYPVIPSRPSFLMELSEVLPKIAQNITDVSLNLNRILDATNRQAIHDTLQNLSTFTKTLSNNSENLNQTMTSLNSTMKNMSLASEQLPDVMNVLHSALNSIDQTSQQLNKTAKAATGTLKNGQVAINNISSQVLPAAQQSLTRFNHLSASLQRLSSELEQNPSLIIRGKVPPAPGPGEK